MAFWAVAAPIIGAAIDWLSGASQQRAAPGIAGRTAYNENYKGLLGRLEAAKVAGIHPALALGSSISGSGSPGLVGSDFRAAFSDASNEVSRQREWKQEQALRKAQEAEQNRRNASEEAVNRAQIDHLTKQNEFIDEQIKASQEQRIREAQRQSKTMASGPHDMGTGFSTRRGRGRIDNVGQMVEYQPNQVTRSVNGEAQGTNPGYETIMLDGKPTLVPFGTTQNHEPSELFQMYRDLDAALQDDGIIGQKIKRVKSWWNNLGDDMPGYLHYQQGPRYRKRYPKSRN